MFRNVPEAAQPGSSGTWFIRFSSRPQSILSMFPQRLLCPPCPQRWIRPWTGPAGAITLQGGPCPSLRSQDCLQHHLETPVLLFGHNLHPALDMLEPGSAGLPGTATHTQPPVSRLQSLAQAATKVLGMCAIQMVVTLGQALHS